MYHRLTKIFIASVQTTGVDNAVYRYALAENIRIGATDGIDAVLKKYNLDALVLPTEGIGATPAGLAGTPFSYSFANCRLSNGNRTSRTIEPDWTAFWTFFYWNGLSKLNIV